MARRAYRASIFHLLDEPSAQDPAAQAEYFEDGVLIVEDGRVAGVGAWDDLASQLGGATVERIGGLLVPGFVDSHVHFPQVDIVASP